MASLSHTIHSTETGTPIDLAILSWESKELKAQCVWKYVQG